MKILLSLLRRLVTCKRSRVGPGRRWQPGAAEVFGVPALERAFLRVRANKGGPGGDGVTLAAFDRTRAQQLFALSAALITGVHRPGPSRRLMIAKPGGARPLCIPTISDRIAQTAWLMALAPILDKRMHKASFAYRPGRGVAEAVAAARAHVVAGRAHVVRVDIVRFFERVPQGMLLAELPHWVTDPQLRGIVGHWLRASAPGGRGLPQGAPISPLLANIHLDAVDRALDAAGVIFVRYADDIVAFARTDRQGRDVLATIEQALATRGLAVNAAKSGVVHASTGVAYLGKHLAKRRFGFLAGVAAWWRRRSIATRDPWAALGDRGD